MEEVADLQSLTPVVFCSSPPPKGRDREDQAGLSGQNERRVLFSPIKMQLLEYYHNSSWLEHGGSPDRAVKLAFVNQIDAFLKGEKPVQKEARARSPSPTCRTA